MKSQIKHLLFRIVLILFIMVGVTDHLEAQPPPPPSPSQQDGPVGGDEPTPIGNGLFIMLALGAAYGLKKWRSRGIR